MLAQILGEVGLNDVSGGGFSGLIMGMVDGGEIVEIIGVSWGLLPMGFACEVVQFFGDG